MTEKKTPIVGEGPKGDQHPPGIGREWTQKAPEREKHPQDFGALGEQHGKRKSTADGLASDEPLPE